MRAILVGSLLAMSLVPAAPQPASPGLDPAGKWSFSTTDPAGTAVTGTMEITGRPGSYRGSYTLTGSDQKLPMTDIVASAETVILLATDANGGTLVVKMSKGTDGKLRCVWGPITQVMSATVARVQ